MVEWIVSSSVLIALILLIRRLFRKKLEMRVLYAFWLIVAMRLLIPFSLVESSISVQNLVKVVENADLAVSMQENLSESGIGTKMEAGYENSEGINAGPDVVGEMNGDGEAFAGIGAVVGNPGDVSHEKLPDRSGWEENLAGVNGNRENIADINAEKGRLDNMPATDVGKSVEVICTYIWLAGVGVSVLLLVGTNILYRREVYASRERRDLADGGLPVYFSHKVNTPCMFGVFRPAIYLTGQACADKKALKYILCHENTHYRHRDNWWAVVRALCVCLHWYNPLVWLAARVSKQDCELACDEETVKQLGEDERIDYGRVLLEFSTAGSSLYGRLQLATTMSGGKKQLKERLQMIVHEPKKYVSALIMVVLLLVLVTGVTFTGKAEESKKSEAREEIQSPVSEESNGDSEQSITASSGGHQNWGSTSIFGYSEYTGYMDLCTMWTGFGAFVGQDYDEDGLLDHVYREDIEDGAMCSYKIEFGSGDVLKVEKIGGGMPAVQAGDLDGDGQNEILFGLSYDYSTDPSAFGEWAIYRKNGSDYEILQLPGSMADYEGDGNGGVLPAYQPKLDLALEKAGDFQARIFSVGADGTEDLGDGFPAQAALDVTVPFAEEEWKYNDLDYYINLTDGYAVNIYTADILEGAQPCIKMYANMFGKWCADEVVTTLVLRDGKLQVLDMKYMQNYTMSKAVDLNDGHEYYLEIGGENQVGSNVHRIKWIYLNEVVDNAGYWVDGLDLEAVTEQEWGSAQEVYSYAADGNMILEDLNFDGYNDLAIQGWIANRNIPYYCWL